MLLICKKLPACIASQVNYSAVTASGLFSLFANFNNAVTFHKIIAQDIFDLKDTFYFRNQIDS